MNIPDILHGREAIWYQISSALCVAACRGSFAPIMPAHTRNSRQAPSPCSRRSRPTPTTWCTPRARPRCWPSARPSSPSGGCAAGRWLESLDEDGERLFTFLRYPPEQWRSSRTTNAIERLHEEFERRIETQCVLPCAETAAMLFWAPLASGRITLRKVDGWQSLAQTPGELDLTA